MAKSKDQPIIPLGHPDLPPVHADFEEWAYTQGTTVEDVIRRCLYGRGEYGMQLSMDKAGHKRMMQIVCGHPWDVYARGIEKVPTKSDVMVVGKCLDADAVLDKRLFMDHKGHIGLGRIFFNACREAGVTIDQMQDFYISSLLATEYLDGGKTNVPKIWYDAQAMLLMQQFLLVQPRICLLQGADSVKRFLGNKFNITSMDAHSEHRTYHDINGEEFSTEFVASMSPAALKHDRGQAVVGGKTFNEKKFGQQIKHFKNRVNGVDPDEMKCEVVWVDNDVDLQRELDIAREQAVNRMVSWDAEWQGRHPNNKNAYLRCMQFAIRIDRSVVIALTHPGGRQRFHIQNEDGSVQFEGAYKKCAEMCKKAMEGMRVLGHYFIADLQWLQAFGLDLYDEYDAAPSWDMVETAGGVATELLAHAIDETSLFGLDEQLATHTNIPKYSQALEDFKKSAATELKEEYKRRMKPGDEAWRRLKKVRTRLKKLTDKGITTARQYLSLEQARDEFLAALDAHGDARQEQELVEEWYAAKQVEMEEGYGWIPDEILYTYAGWDAAAELELGRVLLSQIRSDRFGNDNRKAYWTTHRAAKAALEINCEGMILDREVLFDISTTFEKKRDELLKEIRKRLRWPTFNPNSRFEFAEALFGEELNGYLQQYGKPKRYRPKGALTIRAEPLRSTGKYPVEWDVIQEQRREQMVAPSTSKQTLGEMFFDGEQLRVRRTVPGARKTKVVCENHKDLLGLFRDYRFISQTLKTLVRPPERQADGLLVRDDNDEVEYEAGITTIVADDGRVRPFVRMTLETGRWAMSPNLQNFSKSKISEYERIIGEGKNVNSRTILRALNAEDEGSGGEDWFLVEQDYLGAELFVVAILSQDEQMIDHCLRNQLDDDDPDFYDIHSALTVAAFRLNCAPTKKGLESVHSGHLRQAGKAVVFGSLYSRGAKAIAISLRQEGVFVTVDEAQKLQDAFFSTYSKAAAFLDQCGARVHNPGWLCNLFGRYRRFPATDNEKRAKAYEREARNAPIQGGVADAMNIACRNIIDERDRRGMRSRLCLQIHDAAQTHTPASELEEVIDRDNGLLQVAMVDLVPLLVRDLDGKPLDIPPYKFGSDVDVYDHWGRAAAADRLHRNGFCPSVSGWKRKSDDSTIFSHYQFPHPFDTSTGQYIHEDLALGV